MNDTAIRYRTLRVRADEIQVGDLLVEKPSRTFNNPGWQAPVLTITKVSEKSYGGATITRFLMTLGAPALSNHSYAPHSKHTIRRPR